MKNLKRTLVMLIAAVISTVILTVLAATASAGTQTWDFSGELDGWRFMTRRVWKGEKSDPAWEIKNGTLRQSNQYAWTFAVVGDDHWDNYAVSARIRIDEPFNAEPVGLIFRARFLPNNQLICYSFNIDLVYEKVTLSRYRYGQISHIYRASPDDEGVAVELGKWYDIRAHVNGGHFQCYINDSLKFERTDEDYIAQGAVGFVSRYSIVSMDDLAVTGGSIEGGMLAEQWAQLKRN